MAALHLARPPDLHGTSRVRLFLLARRPTNHTPALAARTGTTPSDPHA